MTNVIFIEKLANGSYNKVVATSSRNAEKFCIDACEYYASIGNVEEANGVPQKPKGQKYEFYAVISAEFTGFVRTWAKCKELTNGKSAKYKGFNSIEAAKTWMRENHAPSKTFEGYTSLKQIK